MKNSKLKIGTLVLGLISLNCYAQQASTNSSPSGVPSGFNDKQFWSRAGNTQVQGINNIFGTMFNSPIYTVTDGQTRTKLNGTLNYAIGTTPSANRSGFMLLTNAPNMPIFGSLNTLMSPFYGAHTLLHLVGDEGLFL